MRTITIELSSEGCQKALKELEAYQKNIVPKLDEVCRRLAEIGADEARRRFNRGDHGNNQVFVFPPIKISNGYKIVAAGEDVYFIEFGTGFNAGTAYGDKGVPPSVSVPVHPGSWSEEHAKAFSEHGYWYYAGEKLQGTEAEMPMYHAEKAIRENEKRVFEEVFGRK